MFAVCDRRSAAKGGAGRLPAGGVQDNGLGDMSAFACFSL